MRINIVGDLARTHIVTDKEPFLSGSDKEVTLNIRSDMETSTIEIVLSEKDLEAICKFCKTGKQ